MYRKSYVAGRQIAVKVKKKVQLAIKKLFYLLLLNEAENGMT